MSLPQTLSLANEPCPTLPRVRLRACALRRDSLRSWLAKPKLAQQAKAGGAGRDRTDDPLLAKQVLSQLSYGP